MALNQPAKRTNEKSYRDQAAYELGMQLFNQEQLPKVRSHRREVHVYQDHYSLIEEISEEY